MSDPVHFHAVDRARCRQRLDRFVQAQHLPDWQHERAAQVHIAVGRREAVEVRAAAGDEQRHRAAGSDGAEVIEVQVFHSAAT